MPLATYDPTDGHVLIFGDLENAPNAVLLRDRSGSTVILNAPTGDSLQLAIGSTSQFIVGTTGFGYPTGVGGAVTQITSRTTGVTLSTVTGTITTNTASLAAEATADFVVTNTRVAVGDVVAVSVQSGTNGGGTIVSVSVVAAGSFTIRVHNGNVAAGTAETGAILINFAVIKAVSA